MASSYGSVINQSVSDICFDVSNIASNIKNATIKQLIDVNKTVNKTKTNQYDLKYQPIEKQSKLVVYVDAAFGNHQNIHCVTDNRSLCDALASNKYVSEKRLRIDIGALKELIKKNNIEHIWVKTNKISKGPE